MMLETKTINIFNDQKTENINKIMKRILLVNFITVINILLFIICSALLNYIISSIPSADIDDNQRYFWIIILSISSFLLFLWLITRITLLLYSFFKIKPLLQKNNLTPQALKIWMKLLSLSFNNYFLYSIFMIDTQLEKLHHTFNMLSLKDKKHLSKKVYLINFLMIFIYSLSLTLLFFLGWGFNLLNDKYFWVFFPFLIIYFIFKITMKMIFIYYLTLFKKKKILNVDQYLNLIDFIKKSRNNYFLQKINQTIYNFFD